MNKNEATTIRSSMKNQKYTTNEKFQHMLAYYQIELGGMIWLCLHMMLMLYPSTHPGI